MVSRAQSVDLHFVIPPGTVDKTISKREPISANKGDFATVERYFQTKEKIGEEVSLEIGNLSL
jgi:hypothetical protein